MTAAYRIISPPPPISLSQIHRISISRIPDRVLFRSLQKTTAQTSRSVCSFRIDMGYGFTNKVIEGTESCTVTGPSKVTTTGPRSRSTGNAFGTFHDSMEISKFLGVHSFSCQQLCGAHGGTGACYLYSFETGSPIITGQRSA